jgi:hypothetical protein
MNNDNIIKYITDFQPERRKNNYNKYEYNDYNNCNEDETIGNTVSILLILFVVIIIIVCIHRYTCKNNNYDFFVNDKLTESGWIVIVSDTCPYCVKQREIIKNSEEFKNFSSFISVQDFIAMVNRGEANPTGFEGGVPFWYNVNLRRGTGGLKTLDKLKGMTTVG